MSVENYYEARNRALRTMTFGLIFLIFLPIGIPVSLIIIPFIAGKNGASKLSKDWHLTYIITVGGGWSLGLVTTIFILLSLALGPSLQINIAEPIIFFTLILSTWLSFTAGVRSTKNTGKIEGIYEQEWEEEDASENEKTNKSIKSKKNKRVIAIPNDNENNQNTDMFSKVKNFIKGPNKKVTPKENGKQNKNSDTSTTKASRVSALASRRRK